MKIRQRMTSQTGRAGLTLIELLLAVAGTGFVATAIVMMLNAVTVGTSDRNDLRQSVVKQKTSVVRLTAALRAAHQVLAVEDDLLILWMIDSDDSAKPNLSEILRIERDAGSGELRAYAAPVTLATELNTEYALTDDFDAITEAIKGSASYPVAIWATGIESWTITIDAAEAQNASLVSSRISINSGSMQDVIIFSAALRN